MSVLLGSAINDNITNGKIIVEPFNKDNVGPNSIDVTLYNKLITYVECDIEWNGHNYYVLEKKSTLDYLDMKKEIQTYELTIPEEGLILTPGILYLGCTNEKAGSEYFIPMYEGRSSMARLGIQSHLSAGFGDINFKSNWTLEITVVHPTKIYPDIRIGQVYFHEVNEESRLKLLNMNKQYSGKYTNQIEPQKSKSYLDFK